MHQKRKTVKKGKKGKPKGRGNRTTPLREKHSGVTHHTGITSDETDVTLRFRSVDAVTGAGPLYVKSFAPNAAYDVDPALGSTETYGFDEYAALYSYYRVISYSYVLRFSCNTLTSDPVTVYILNTNTQPSGTRFDLFSTNPYCQTKVLTAYGNSNTITFRGRHAVSQIVGSLAPETEDNYRALTSASPADLVWLTMAFECRSGSNVALEWIADIYLNVRFYGREIDLTLAGTSARLLAKLEQRRIYQEEKSKRIAVEKARAELLKS